MVWIELQALSNWDLAGKIKYKISGSAQYSMQTCMALLTAVPYAKARAWNCATSLQVFMLLALMPALGKQNENNLKTSLQGDRMF